MIIHILIRGVQTALGCHHALVLIRTNGFHRRQICVLFKNLVGRRVYLELLIVGVHGRVRSPGLHFHSVHHLGKICGINIIEFLLIFIIIIIIVKIFGNPEIGDLGLPIRIDQHVARLKVTMQLILLQVQIY